MVSLELYTAQDGKVHRAVLDLRMKQDCDVRKRGGFDCLFSVHRES